MKNIIILGGSYAGISTAHRVLKQASKLDPFKITLVTPNTDLYWNMASPRGIIPGQVPDEKLFQPIADGFKQYPASQFEFILASAESLDVETKKVGISGGRVLDYDFLIIATGSHTDGGAPFKGLGTTEATKEAVHDFQARIKKAKTVVVAGAGVTGVEACGEIAYEYGRQKEIILISSGSSILEGTPPSIQKHATKELQNLKVDIKYHAKVTSTAQTPDGRQELTLSSGDKLVTDMYIPTFGLIPNSSFIPSKYLNSKGYIKVDEYLQVKGTKDIYAIGDVSDIELEQFIVTDKQSTALSKNLITILSNKIPVPYKVAGTRMMGLQIGKKAGTGHYGNMKIPSFVIVFARKNLFTEKIEATVNGSLF